MKTTFKNYITNFYIYYTFCFSYGIRKEKTKLTDQFCSFPVFAADLLYTILFGL